MKINKSISKKAISEKELTKIDIKQFTPIKHVSRSNTSLEFIVCTLSNKLSLKTPQVLTTYFIGTWFTFQ